MQEVDLRNICIMWLFNVGILSVEEEKDPRIVMLSILCQSIYLYAVFFHISHINKDPHRT